MAVAIEQLRDVCKELNKKLGLDPAIAVGEDVTEAALKKAVKEAMALVEKSDKFSKETMAVLEDMKCVPDALKAKEKKAAPKKDKGPGVIQTIADLIVEKGPITKEKILKELSKKFPDRDPEAMMKTINVQLPNRMNSERGMKITLTEDGYVNKKK